MGDQERGRRRPFSAGDSAHEPNAKLFRGQANSSASRTLDPRNAPSPKDERPSTSRQAAACETNTPRGPATGGGNGSNRVQKRMDRFEIVHTRPVEVVSKVGKEGAPIQLLSNYFRLNTTPKWRIVHYHVDLSPEIELLRVRCGILSDHAAALGKGYLFDGKQLFTTKKFEQDITILNGKSKQDINYTITIKFVGFISTAEERFLQVLNLILRRSMKGLNLEQVGRNLFDPHAKVSMREFSLELWPGYETSIRQHERDIMLCSEIAHKVMRTETVYDILVRSSQNPARHQEEFRMNVLGLIVLTDYNNKTYRINDVDFTKSPLATFNCKGRDISFVEYYLTKYNIRIRDHKQPLLVSKNKDKAQNTNANELVILIPELCRVTGLTDNMRSNFQLKRAMADHTQLNPARRIDRLRTFNRRLQTTPESVRVLNDWNMKLDENLVEIQGRIIAPQKILFLNNRISAGDQADWTRYFRDNQMFTTPSQGLDRWAVIAPQRNSRDLRTLLQNLNQVARGMGFQIRSPRETMIYDDRTGSYIQALDDCARIDPQLILCLVPNNNTERYSSIKKRGCVDKAIPTQVVTTKATQRGMSVATKIAIQINCKLGYTPWMIDLPLSGLMTIGFDIAKCTRDRSKAYGALVASMDQQQNSTYFSTVAECSAYDVMANNLWPMMLKALRQYHREHQKLPARIVFYRDGVSSGSLKHLVEYEVKDIVEKLEAEYQRAGSTTPPMLAYIVVSRAANTRLFTSSKQNPPPGTVVDDVITMPERYDFYLVSQAVRHGTVAPTSYNVVHSKIRLSPDQIQKLTYKMCHLYYNWSGTTRVPAVCQYAKKLATLVGTNIHAIPQNALEKKFYYL
ncbi:protein piwi [Drosophila nasuta]|uniref:protein piwi n=1 Tax=Drosophila nasuta TaxID=42062 RepID=UPI00295EC0CE|nr:protein piwi [Drosophila nasuta]